MIIKNNELSNIKQEAISLLEGAFDLYLHAAPDGFNRSADYLEVAREAELFKMAGLVFMDHFFPTTGLTYLTDRIVSKIKCFSSITISRCIGGFNAEAVEQALKEGAKIIFFPTLDSYYFRNWCLSQPYLKHLINKLSLKESSNCKILDNQRKITREVYNILLLVKKYGVILSLGHLSPNETFIVVENAQRLGIKKIKIQHPQSKSGLSLNQQIELSSKGVYMSYTFLNCFPEHGQLLVKDLVYMIKAVGAERSILSSDAGQSNLPRHIDILKNFISSLLSHGISSKEISRMIKDNPKHLLLDV